MIRKMKNKTKRQVMPKKKQTEEKKTGVISLMISNMRIKEKRH